MSRSLPHAPARPSYWTVLESLHQWYCHSVLNNNNNKKTPHAVTQSVIICHLFIFPLYFIISHAYEGQGKWRGGWVRRLLRQTEAAHSGSVELDRRLLPEKSVQANPGNSQLCGIMHSTSLHNAMICRNHFVADPWRLKGPHIMQNPLYHCFLTITLVSLLNYFCLLLVSPGSMCGVLTSSGPSCEISRETLDRICSQKCTLPEMWALKIDFKK